MDKVTEKDAIDEIVGLSSLRDQAFLDTHTPTAVIPSSARLVSLEQYGSRPLRHRVQFTTSILEEFLDYVNKNHAGDRSIISVDPTGNSALAIFDHGVELAPGWGDHRAELNLKFTPEFRALVNANGNNFSQTSFIDWIEDWGHTLTFLDEEEKKMPMAVAINSIRTVTIDRLRSERTEEGDFSASKSALDSVAAKSNSGKLPAKILATCETSPGLDPIDVTLRIRVRTGGDKPVFVPRIVALEKIEEDRAEEVAHLIRSSVNEGIPVYLGELARK